jgi:hypothetical protein
MARSVTDEDGNTTDIREVFDTPGATAGEAPEPAWADAILPDPFLS